MGSAWYVVAVIAMLTIAAPKHHKVAVAAAMTCRGDVTIATGGGVAVSLSDMAAAMASATEASAHNRDPTLVVLSDCRLTAPLIIDVGGRIGTLSPTTTTTVPTTLLINGIVLSADASLVLTDVRGGGRLVANISVILRNASGTARGHFVSVVSAAAVDNVTLVVADSNITIGPDAMTGNASVACVVFPRLSAQRLWSVQSPLSALLTTRVNVSSVAGTACAAGVIMSASTATRATFSISRDFVAIAADSSITLTASKYGGAVAVGASGTFTGNGNARVDLTLDVVSWFALRGRVTALTPPLPSLPSAIASTPPVPSSAVGLAIDSPVGAVRLSATQLVGIAVASDISLRLPSASTASAVIGLSARSELGDITVVANHILFVAMSGTAISSVGNGRSGAVAALLGVSSSSDTSGSNYLDVTNTAMIAINGCTLDVESANTAALGLGVNTVAGNNRVSVTNLTLSAAFNTSIAVHSFSVTAVVAVALLTDKSNRVAMVNTTLALIFNSSAVVRGTSTAFAVVPSLGSPWSWRSTATSRASSIRVMSPWWASKCRDRLPPAAP